jgi:hypothetical protein
MRFRYCISALFAGALLMIVCSHAAVAQGSVQISIPDLTALPLGSTQTIPVSLDSPIEAGDNVTSYTIEITFNPDVLTIDEIDDTGTLTEGWTATPNTPDPGRFVVNALNPDQASPLVASSGTIVNLTVTLDVDVNSSSLTFTNITQLTDDITASDGSLQAIGGNTSAGNDLVITEIHADPATGPDGDANNDGTTDDGDQFIEVVNAGTTTIDLDGYTLTDGDGTVLYTFGSASLDPNVSVVVFGGGTPAGIDGLVFVAGSGLNLDGAGGTVELNDNAGERVDGATYGPEANADQSVTRAPGLTDGFEQHTTVGTGVRYSPGASPDGTALPVELTTFTVTPDGKDLLVAWSTVSETRNAGFGVELRRADGASTGGYEEAAFVNGAGTTAQRQDYQVRLRDLKPGIYLVRLRQVDVDGSATYSAPQRAEIAFGGRFIHRPASPNPFQHRAAFQLQVRETQPVRVDLYSVLGQHVQTVFTGTLQGGASATTIEIDGQGLASGLYLYRIVGRNFETTGRLTRVR